MNSPVALVRHTDRTRVHLASTKRLRTAVELRYPPRVNEAHTPEGDRSPLQANEQGDLEWAPAGLSEQPHAAWNVVTPVPTQVSSDSLGYNVERYDVSSIDGCARKYFEASPSRRDPLLLDLREVRYLEHECLVHLGALFAESKRLGRPICLRLPLGQPAEVPKLTDFLRSWKFPDFIGDITGAPFSTHLLQSDRASWRNLPEVSQFTPVTHTPDGDSELLPRTFFALTPIRSLGRPSLAAKSEQSRFLQVSFKGVLKQLLGDKPDEDLRARQIATQIINEAVKNAAMHPHARLAYTSTQIRLPRVEDGDKSTGSLEISVWDDGDSISTTLNQTVSAGLPITTSHFGREEEIFKVAINPHPARPDGTRFEISSRIDPARYSTEHLALTVAAFLNGVTSKPGLRVITRDPVSDEDTGDERAMRLGEGGIGLRALRRAAIDLLGGRIQYISGHDRLIMTQYVAQDGSVPRNTYRVIIRRNPQGSWDSVGNHLQISVPFVRAGVA